MSLTSRFYRLDSHVRHYDWGMRRHGDSVPFIADLLGEDAGKSIPWAELWIGAHPSLSSDIQTDNGSCRLDMALAENPAALGDIPAGADAGRLPFLLKILSCERALSIQSHPDKPTAEKLHAQYPANYPDANHKPEIMIAVTPFEALAGFRKLEDVMAELDAVAALEPWRRVATSVQKVTMRTLCETLLNLPATIVRDMLVNARRELAEKSAISDASALFLALLEQNPCDRGTLFAFILNHRFMAPGDSMFIPANIPHAYLCGTGIECMANSDNVIRAGLTRKFVDSRHLLATLDFDSAGAALSAGTELSAGITVYAPPVKEFKVTVFAGEASCEISRHGRSACVFLVLDGAYSFDDRTGNAQTGHRGTTWFRPATLADASVRPVGKNSRLVMAEVGE